MDRPDILRIKALLLRDLLAKLEAEYQTLRAAQKAAHEGATHEESKPENDKDTRALEQSYLARGQAERVEQLHDDLQLLRQLSPRSFEEDAPAALGALLTLEDEDGSRRLVFLVPVGAGETLPSELGEVKTVTPKSPLGRAVVGNHEGDEVEWRGPAGRKTLLLAEIR